MSTVTVVIAAGGTGGHVFPGIAVAQWLRGHGAKVAWLGTSAGLEQRLVPARDIEFHTLEVRGVRRMGWRRRITMPFTLLRAVLEARALLRQIAPDVVLGMGGYVSGPAGLASRAMRTPLLVHEQNARPGLTNRVLAKLATRVLEAFDGSFGAAAHATHVGNPVREDIAALAPPSQRFAGRSGPLRLLVLGGSQGAQALNEVIPAALGKLAGAGGPAIECWLQCGRDNADSVNAACAAAGATARVEPFIEDMVAAYGWADLVVCRSGAMTVSEVAAAGIGALFVPYPFAVDDHQAHNANYLVSRGAAELWRQSSLSTDALADRLAALASDRAALLSMAEAARAAARPEAAADVGAVCLELAASGARGGRG